MPMPIAVLVLTSGYGATNWCYDPTMRCPVLTWAVVLNQVEFKPEHASSLPDAVLSPPLAPLFFLLPPYHS
eukprot:1439202-Rhodomonas_salina.1